MARVVLMISVSLDGFIEGPNREIDWHVVDDELHWHFNDELRHAGAFLDGRVTWELMARFWPTADADPAAPAPVVDFARIWRGTPKVVYSRTLQRAGWNTTIAREVVPADIAALKREVSGDLFLGGADLAATFLRLGLVDELRLYVHPVLIGTGTPCFRRPWHRRGSGSSTRAPLPPASSWCAICCRAPWRRSQRHHDLPRRRGDAEGSSRPRSGVIVSQRRTTASAEMSPSQTEYALLGRRPTARAPARPTARRPTP